MAKQRREVSFDVTAVDRDVIKRIVSRASEMGLVRGRKSRRHWYDRLTCTMDLTATHANGCRMRLQDFLEADDFNFTHDIAGIARHIDRETGKLTAFFRPRCARPARLTQMAV